MNEQRNLIIAIVLSILVMLGFQYYFAPPPKPASTPAQTAADGGPVPVPQGQVSAPGVLPQMAGAPDRKATIAAAPRVKIDTPALHGSINLKGGRIDDLTLVRYHEKPDTSSPEVTLLSPPGTNHPYYAEFGWVAADAAVTVPNADTVWQASGEVLTPKQPLELTWTSPQGLTFKRVISVDENYLFSVKQSVANAGGQPVTLFPYALISRQGKPKTEDYYILHEGPLGVLEGSLKEVKYGDLDEDGTIKAKTQGGWLGFTDKYWLTALVPAQGRELTGRMLHTRVEAVDKYQTDFTGEGRVVAPGETISDETHLFAGAKRKHLLDAYAEKLNAPLFDRAIDFGWFWFLTIPFFDLLIWIHGHVGNFGIAILVITVILKGVMFPLANKSYKAMSKMKKLAPKVKELQERFADDKMRLNQEMMALYKREQVNPASGCLPILVQIPIFFALYKVLFVAIEMRHAPFFGWINDLSAPDPTTVFNLFGLIPWDPPAFLMIGLWPLIMGVTMYLQQKLNPQPADPIQAKMFTFLPIVFTFLLATFPAGLVIYWAWSNLLSILQQWVIMKRAGAV